MHIGRNQTFVLRVFFEGLEVCLICLISFNESLAHKSNIPENFDISVSCPFFYAFTYSIFVCPKT